jgi:hypothetical protein
MFYVCYKTINPSIHMTGRSWGLAIQVPIVLALGILKSKMEKLPFFVDLYSDKQNKS